MAVLMAAAVPVQANFVVLMVEAESMKAVPACLCAPTVY
jgi:hypothetical protein